MWNDCRFDPQGSEEEQLIYDPRARAIAVRQRIFDSTTESEQLEYLVEAEQQRKPDPLSTRPVKTIARLTLRKAPSKQFRRKEQR